MPLIRLGEYEGAPDGHIDFLLRTEGTLSRQATIDLIVNALAAFPGVTEAAALAAATAVADAIIEENLVRGDDDRLPTQTEPDVFAFLTRNGGRPLVVTPNGIRIGSTAVESSKNFRIKSRNGGTLFDVDPVSAVVSATHLRVKTLEVTGQGSGSAGGVAVDRILQIDVAWSQSAPLGRALPISPQLDPPDPRILQYQWGSGALVTATTPLSAPVTATGLSPVMTFARALLASQPPGLLIVIVCGAVGDTGVLAPTENGVWARDYAGPYTALWPQAMNASQATHNALVTKYGITPRHILFSDQGEADGSAGIAQADYTNATDLLVADHRSRFGATSLLLVKGQVPEWTGTDAARLGIRASRLDTIRRHYYAGWADGIPNSGGSNRTGTVGGTPTDLVHAGREGIERAGKDLVDAYYYALTNLPESTRYAMTPQVVRARRVGTALTVEWSQPFGHVTGYTVQYSLDGGSTWTTIPHATVDRKATATLPSASPALVTVTAINANGPSAASTPVHALAA